MINSEHHRPTAASISRTSWIAYLQVNYRRHCPASALMLGPNEHTCWWIPCSMHTSNKVPSPPARAALATWVHMQTP